MKVKRELKFALSGIFACCWAWFEVPITLPVILQVLFFWTGITFIGVGVGSRWKLPALTGKNWMVHFLFFPSCFGGLI